MPALERLGAIDTARVVGGVLLPMVARGVIVRRPGVTALVDHLDADRRAVAILTEIRDRRGPGPVLLGIPGRDIAIMLEPDDVERLLGDAPEPFTPANREKRTALRHFQPAGVLISDAEHRALRRPFNEDVLDHREEQHRLHERLVRIAAEEIGTIEGPVLAWEHYAAAHWRIVRRVVLGDRAREDHGVTEVLNSLRAQANWAFLRPRSRRRMRGLAQSLRGYLTDPEPCSLAEIVARAPAPPGTAAMGQIPHWLFAFDAAGIASFRGLALLAAQPAVQESVRREDPSHHRGLRPLARATMLESLRLWPTTLVILRDSTAESTWHGRHARAGTGFAVPSSFFHRDTSRLPWADAFTPEIWLDGRAATSGALVPFSAGPARCPGRTLVLDLAGEILAATTQRGQLTLAAPRPLDPQQLPGSLAPTRVALRLSASVEA